MLLIMEIYNTKFQFIFVAIYKAVCHRQKNDKITLLIIFFHSSHINKYFNWEQIVAHLTVSNNGYLNKLFNMMQKIFKAGE